MQRKLAAILAADVVGYSGLMQADEAGTLARLKTNRAQLFEPQVAAHGGRVFKLLGDGALAEFASVVQAVACALTIQEATEKADAGEGGIRYRIGVNLGDVLVEEDDIYGDGVNVAARLQTLAPIGGVAVSAVVREQVEGKVGCAFDDMGAHRVKDHERAVHVFAARLVTRNALQKQSAERRQLSICVLPFANLSDDPQQEYFVDGICEDIITDLGKVAALFVISRNTAFQFKGRNVDVTDIAKRLKVGHVLEGSVRKAGGRVRITAQLVEGQSGGHVWTERYDRELSDIFALQDEIAEAIVGALKLKLLPEEKRAIERRGTESVEAYNFYLMARQLYLAGRSTSAQGSESIVRLCSGATNLDPDYAQAWALMALAQAVPTTSQSTDRGSAAADRALSLDPSLAEAHVAKGRVLYNNVDLIAARKEYDTALALDPELFEANMNAGLLELTDGRHEAAVALLEKAASLSPDNPNPVITLLYSYRALGNSDAERRTAKLLLQEAERVLAQQPDDTNAMGFAVQALGVLGESARVKEMMGRGMLLDPENGTMKLHFVQALAKLNEIESALELAESMMNSPTLLLWLSAGAKNTQLAVHPRFVAMLTKAESRLNPRPFGRGVGGQRGKKR